jgi:hypothetical protein
VLIGGLLGAVAVLGTTRLPTRLATVAAAVALGATLAGPAAYAMQTASQAHTGSIPTAGPAVSGGGPGGFPGGGRGNRGIPGGIPGGGTAPGGTAPGGSAPGGTAAGGTAAGGTARGGGMGGLLDAATVSSEMKTLLAAGADEYTWAAAAVGSQSASGYQLATGKPVMAVGGFNGSDPSPALAQFQQYVTEGRIHYFIGGGGFGGRGGTGTSSGGSNYSSQIAAWVAANYTARTVGTTTVYDLSVPMTGGTTV